MKSRATHGSESARWRIHRDGGVTTRAWSRHSIEVWSVADGRMAVRIQRTGTFGRWASTTSGRAFVLNNENGKQVVQAWDARTAPAGLHDGARRRRGRAGASAETGRLLANLNNAKLRVYDLQENKLVGEKPVELAFRQIGRWRLALMGRGSPRACWARAPGPAQAPAHRHLGHGRRHDGAARCRRWRTRRRRATSSR
jgi:hypothetical protein